ncbi:MAG: phage portal protein, partial [Tidjanibacter sp.]|nr:phage portal protein [Tidjanibacter sp.]
MDNKKVNYSAKLFSPRSSVQNPFMPAVRSVSDNRFWRWGDDNLFPVALSLLARQSTTHRRIINDKADYISGKGLTCDEGLPHISSLIKRANPLGDSLRSVLNRLAMDKALFGNAFVEVVTDAGRTFLALFHQDASLCRLSRDGAGVLLHHDWSRPSSGEMKYLPLFPAFAEGEDGKLHSII